MPSSRDASRSSDASLPHEETAERLLGLEFITAALHRHVDPVQREAHGPLPHRHPARAWTRAHDQPLLAGDAETGVDWCRLRSVEKASKLRRAKAVVSVAVRARAPASSAPPSASVSTRSHRR